MCVDDHAIVVEGLRVVINLQHDMRVVATASRGDEAVSLHRKHRPDVTLMDLQLRGMDGVETIKAIRRESNAGHIVVLTMHDGDREMYRAIAAGAEAYVLKDVHSDELIGVIRDVNAGRRSDHVEPTSVVRASEPSLTRREQQILQLIADGKRNKEVAEVLRISDETVHTHLKNLFEKLEVRDRSRAVAIGIRRGIVQVR